ncbi:MAG: hypothetical protein A2036_01305 [Omnitrophica bacterium GWA2_50_21]|nr:MAG: hypothetical protein A2036_01305 [Omnitrophica bacterium GWA2_50_21]
MKKWPGALIKIGVNNIIDEDVILGYPTGRAIAETELIIGDSCVIRSGTIIYRGTCIGDRLNTGHNVVIREQNIIGTNVSIWSNTVIDYACKIGNGVKIHSNIYVAQYTVIEDDVFIAPGVSFANDKYPLSDNLQGPVVKKGARIGVNATLLPGVIINEGAVVGAGCVVTKNVNAFSVVVGNPAKELGNVSDIFPDNT